MGGAGPLNAARFHPPPFKPDVPISGIRLTGGFPDGACVGARTRLPCQTAGVTPQSGLQQRIGQRLASAWLPSIAAQFVLAPCRRAIARGGGWTERSRSCPSAYRLLQRNQSRGPSLRPRSSARSSSVLPPPRTPAARRSTSPSPYTSALPPTWAVQTGLSCSSPSLDRVLLPLPRRDPARRRRY